MAAETWIKCPDGGWRTAKDIAKSEARKRYRSRVRDLTNEAHKRRCHLRTIHAEYEATRENVRLRNLANDAEWTKAGEAR
jgi:hypothetical protein